MKTMVPKYFDCLNFKRKSQEKIYEEIKGLTQRQEIAYFNRYKEIPSSWQAHGEREKSIDCSNI